MFGLGMGEIVIILVLALILLGPQKLPDAAKQLGKGLREFRKATEDLKSQFETELYAEPKPSGPKLVDPPVTTPPASATAPAVTAAAEAVPVATAQNVPGLDAALIEKPVPDPALAASPAPSATTTAEAPKAS